MRGWVLVLSVVMLLGLTSAAMPAQANDRFASLRTQLQKPENQVDLAEAKIVIDGLIDPATDSAAILKELAALTEAITRRIPPGLTKRAELDVLLETLYKPGPWNGNRPFSYDLNDPFGRNGKNKLLATYLRTRKGNCVSMPILVAILGQRLGLIMTLATAPEHVMVKFVDDEGRWLNVEATAGGFKADSSYERETGIGALAIRNEIYLRPLSPREAVGVMVSTLMEQLAAQKRGDDLMAVADMVLAANPKDTVAIIQKGNAYYLQLQDRYASRYPGLMDIPTAQQADYQHLSRENLAWFAKAERLGWTPKTPEQETKYLHSIRSEETKRGQR